MQVQLPQVQRRAQVGFHQAALTGGDIQFQVETLVTVTGRVDLAG